MKTLHWTRLVVTTSLLTLAACGGGSSGEDESSADAVTTKTFAHAAEFRETVEACDRKASAGSKFGCLKAANDAENLIIDQVQRGNYGSGIASNDYISSVIPTYRDDSVKLCNVLSGKPAKSADAPPDVQACLVKRERDLSMLILDVVYDDAGEAKNATFASACQKPAEINPVPATDRGLKDAANDLERWSDCVKEGFAAAYKPKVSATFDVCLPGEPQHSCRTHSVLDSAVVGASSVCRVLGYAARVREPYPIARVQNECIEKALVQMAATPL